MLTEEEIAEGAALLQRCGAWTARLSLEAARQLLLRCKLRTFQTNEVIAAKDAPLPTLLVLLKGRAQVRDRRPPPRSELEGGMSLSANLETRRVWAGSVSLVGLTAPPETPDIVLCRDKLSGVPSGAVHVTCWVSPTSDTLPAHTRRVSLATRSRPLRDVPPPCDPPRLTTGAATPFAKDASFSASIDDLMHSLDSLCTPRVWSAGLTPW